MKKRVFSYLILLVFTLSLGSTLAENTFDIETEEYLRIKERIDSLLQDVSQAVPITGPLEAEEDIPSGYYLLCNYTEKEQSAIIYKDPSYTPNTSKQYTLGPYTCSLIHMLEGYTLIVEGQMAILPYRIPGWLTENYPNETELTSTWFYYKEKAKIICIRIERLEQEIESVEKEIKESNDSQAKETETYLEELKQQQEALFKELEKVQQAARRSLI